MTVKTLTGTYSAGYTLSARYSRLDISATASVGGAGIITSAAATIVNDGHIAAEGGAAGRTGIDLTAGGVVVNNALIKGGWRGAGMYVYGGEVVNTGSISGGAGGMGLFLRFGSGDSTGVIIGGRGGAAERRGEGGTGGDGMDLAESDFRNRGVIAGGRGGVGGPIGPGGEGGAGVSMGFGDGLTNTGTIAGGLGGDGDDGAQGLGVFAGGGNIVNGSASARAALITGYEGIYARAEFGLSSYATTVTNYGTIDGTGGVAIQLVSSRDRLIDEAGSVFEGAVDCGGGTLELAAGSGMLAGLGAAFNGFGAYRIDAGGVWALSGTITAGAIVSIAATGVVQAAIGASLTLRGAVTNNGALELSGGELTAVGVVTGLGHVVINGGTADFASSFSQPVRFGAAGGRLELTDSQAFNGVIYGFSAKGAATLDLRDIGFVGADEATFSGTGSGGVLTVTDGTHTAQIHLNGDHLGSTFAVSSDGGAGVIVVDAGAPTIPTAAVATAATVAGATRSAAEPAQTTRTLTGTYASGYSLSTSYSALVVDASAVIGAQAGAAGTPGEYATDGGVGGVGITIGFAASLTNAGAVAGGVGGAGGDSPFVSGAGNVFRAGAAGAGGAGLSLARGARLTNSGTLSGGAGGVGGVAIQSEEWPAGLSFYGGGGGDGGDGVYVAGGGPMINRGRIVGGQGGAGGSAGYHLGFRPPSFSGAGGQGGAGIYLRHVAAIDNLGTVVGGQGGSGASGPYSNGDGGVGGAGIDLVDGGRLVSAGLIAGGNGGAGGAPYATGGAGGGGVLLAGGASLTNTGTVAGGVGGQGSAIAAAGGVGVYVAAGAGLQSSGVILGGAGGSGSYGVVGGMGGVGVYLAAGVSLAVAGRIGGGAGGLAGYTKPNRVIDGGLGGAGVWLGAGASLSAMGVITGGMSGQGGTGAAGAYLTNDATLSNEGTVNGGQGGQYGVTNGGQGGAGVFVYYGGDVFNTGSITGGAGGQGAELGNRYLGPGGDGLDLRFGDGYSSGVITGGQGGSSQYGGPAGGTGVWLTGRCDFDNSGRIVGGYGGSGGGGTGVDMALGQSFANTGTIIGGLGKAGQGDGVAAYGGSLVNGGLTARAALITGAVGVSDIASTPTTVTNFGTIEGSSGVAIDFGYKGRLIVEPGAVFEGAVHALAGVMELAAGKATLEGLGAAFSGFGSYEIDAGGVWSLSGATAADATVSVAARGVVEEAAGATLTLQGAVTNDGALEPYRGDLTVDGAVSGKGVVVISGGTAAFMSTFSQNTRFGAAGGELELADSRAFQAVVSGFSTNGATRLDLRDIGFVSADEATFSGTTTGGVLTVAGRTRTARITLTGDYIGSAFIVSRDGSGGVVVVDRGTPSPHLFIASMAGMSAGASAIADPQPIFSSGAQSILAHPTP